LETFFILQTCREVMRHSLIGDGCELGELFIP
jgi:hypothetical protein